MKVKFLSWPMAIGAFLLAEAVYLPIMLWSIPHLSAAAGGLQVFDLMPPGYSPAYAAQLLTALGQAGRDWYLKVQLVLDLFYPGLLGLYGFLMLRLLTKSIAPPLRWLAWLPVAGAFFDYAENAFIFAMLKAWPRLPDWIVVCASWATRIKSGFVMAAVIALLALLSVLAIRGLWSLFAKAKGGS